jgi:thiol-disulfide isomerase/thioredoxin
MSDVAPKPNGNRPLLIVALLFVVGWAFITIISGLHRGPHRLSVPTLYGQGIPLPAEYDWNLLELDGTPVNFSHYRGKAVFLNVWATWCPPCRAELPSIDALASNPKLADVSFVCASTDDSAEDVKSFLARTRLLGGRVEVFRIGPQGVPRVFITDGIPATFLLAPDGKIAASVVGSANWNHPSVVQFLERLVHPPKGTEP